MPNNVNYQINKDGETISIIRSPQATGEIKIPSEVEINGKKYTVTSILQEAFYGTSLTSVDLPNSLKFIEGWAFQDCSLKNVTFGNSLYSIGPSAFASCHGLTSVKLPNSLRSLQDYAFWDCSGLRNIEIGNSLTSINEETFGDCFNLISISLPDNIISIGDGAFSDCIGLKEIRLSESLKSIGEGSFIGCANLSSITIPESVESIGKQAFIECPNLMTVNYPSSDPIVAPEDVFDWKTYLQGTLKINDQAIDKARKINPWKNFSSIIGSDSSDIEIINLKESESKNNIKVYNINGVYISNSLSGLKSGIYIIREGSKSKKICINE